MHLGRLIEKLRSEQDAAVALESLNDIALFASVGSMAAHYQETPAAYVALAASRFANLAEHDDWVGVIGSANRSADPAQAVLVHMLRWSLQRDAQELTATTSHCDREER